MNPIIGENICIKVSIGCSSFVIELPTLSLAEQPVDFNLLKFQISLARPVPMNELKTFLFPEDKLEEKSFKAIPLSFQMLKNLSSRDAAWILNQLSITPLRDMGKKTFLMSGIMAERELLLSHGIRGASHKVR